MDFDELDNGSIHSDNRRQPPRQNGLPNGNQDPDENGWEDTASNAGSARKITATDGEGSLFGAVKHRTTSSSLSEFSELKQRILAFERQLAALRHNDDASSVAGKYTAADNKPDLDVISENGFTESAAQLQIIPESCEKTWPEFMNKYAGESKEYAIEVLPEEPDYYHPKKEATKPDRKHGRSRAAVAISGSKAEAKHPVPLNGRRSVPSRIRINSTLILKNLKNLHEHIDPSTSLVMMRPFKFLVHYEAQIRESVRALEQQLDSTDANASSDAFSSPHESPISNGKEVLQETIEHMRCLTDFMDRDIRPTLTHLENTSNGKIHFYDLWYIFKPGVDIHMPLRVQDTSVTVDALETTPETFQGRYNQVWRVTGTSGGRPNLSAAQNRSTILRSNPFRVDMYYIDFHGRYFRPTVHTFEIMPFKGERDINSLEFYPERYMAKSQQQETLNAHLEKGKVIFDTMARSFTHFFYQGPTVMVHPCGCKIEDGPIIQEYIESEVIVDFKMTLRKYPLWRPPREPWKDPVIERKELQETFPVQYWTDHRKTKLESTEYDQVYNDYFIDRERALNFQNAEQIFAPIPSGWLSNESMVPDQDISLYPGRVFCFILRTRTFAPLWLWGLQPIKAKTEGLHNLQLKDNSFKNTLQALVKTHFMQKQAQNSPNFEYDIVRGKGKGLVILLHGAPGLGKTFTAESVAAANGQPLLQITCGDLGLNPKEVDAALKECFYYAQHWRAVLLLDECDIFLQQRSKMDVKRNALVSIFLRVLEFYTGVLFLTTNRVGALDEAIKSRITWISYYPPLNWSQTKEIWKTNIKRVEKGSGNVFVDRASIMKFAKVHWQISNAPDSESAVWNGRQIMNAFKVAIALARWETYSEEERAQTDRLTLHDDNNSITISATQLSIYATGIKAFDSYLKEATGSNDADRAFHAQERADDYESEDTTPLRSPRGEVNQFPAFVPPYEELRRTSSMGLVPPSSDGRASSPNLRPQLPARLSTSRLLQNQRPPVISRQSAAGTSSPMSPPRRRSSQLASPAQLSPPVTRRRLSTERRGSNNHDVRRQSYVEQEDTGIETEETDSYLYGNDTVDDDEYSSGG